MSYIRFVFMVGGDADDGINSEARNFRAGAARAGRGG